MTDNNKNIIRETDNYIMYASEPVQDVALERHYAILNKLHDVVEYRTPVYVNAIQYMDESDEFINDAAEATLGDIQGAIHPH